jgi:RNA polymerase sigma factor (sigma-70 family)
MPEPLESLVDQARNGDRDALERLVQCIQDRIYGVAVRMLWHPEDAQDATQEILIRIVTHLGTFRGESGFITWAYRVAANYLLTARKGRIEAQGYTFARFGEELEEGLSDELPSGEQRTEQSLLLEEVKIGCTLGMLSCLDRPHRLAYILGEILEMDGEEAAGILEIEPATFRKRLSRARSDIIAFTRAKCGLVNPRRPCRCRRRVGRALQLGRVDPDHLLFASDAERARGFGQVVAEIRRLEEARRAAALYRSHPDLFAPQDFAGAIRGLLSRDPHGGA